MKNFFSLLLFTTQLMMAQNSIVLGDTLYQNQAFSIEDKEIFDSDKEGSRVWSWSQAKRYCKKLKLDGHDGWSVASQKEVQRLISKIPESNGLYIYPKFAHKMPKTAGKYDNVWMWTRDEKSSKIGAFVNFKKAKLGWADKKYKGYVLCTRAVKKIIKKIRYKSPRKAICKGDSKQELTHSTDWVASWRTCSGDGAIKKDGTLWQFGKVGGCDWGQIMPIDPQTGKPEFKKKKIYHLNPMISQRKVLWDI